jgi:hypothetical protein
VIESRDPGDWVDDQLADIEAKRKGDAPASVIGSKELEQ